MKVTTSQITKYVLTELDKLDPVTMVLEDFGAGKGKLTIDCYGKAWTAYWGAMGSETIAEFINTADVDYLANKLSTVPSSKTDYEAISRKIGIDVDRETLILHSDKMVEAYGRDWYMDLPTTRNEEYDYLCRIVSAVKEAVRTVLAKAA